MAAQRHIVAWCWWVGQQLATYISEKWTPLFVLHTEQTVGVAPWKKWSHLHLMFVLYVGSITFNVLRHFNYVDMNFSVLMQIKISNNTTYWQDSERDPSATQPQIEWWRRDLCTNSWTRDRRQVEFPGLRQQRRVRDKLGRYWVSRQGKKRWKVVHNTEDNLATGTCGCVT